MEEWRPVVGWEGLYEVSDLGRVRSLDRMQPYLRRGRDVLLPIKGRILKGGLDSYGYRFVVLKENERRANAHVAHVVAEAFLGPRLPGIQVAHWNGLRTDDRLANLRYSTQVENEADKIRHGTGIAGREGLSWRLNVEERALLRKNVWAWSKAELAEMFGCTPSAITYYRSAKLKRTKK